MSESVVLLGLPIERSKDLKTDIDEYRSKKYQGKNWKDLTHAINAMTDILTGDGYAKDLKRFLEDFEKKYKEIGPYEWKPLALVVGLAIFTFGVAIRKIPLPASVATKTVAGISAVHIAVAIGVVATIAAVVLQALPYHKGYTLQKNVIDKAKTDYKERFPEVVGPLIMYFEIWDRSNNRSINGQWPVQRDNRVVDLNLTPKKKQPNTEGEDEFITAVNTFAPKFKEANAEHKFVPENYFSGDDSDSDDDD